MAEPADRKLYLGPKLRVLRRVGGRLFATDVARTLKVSREHLSRQFGAGGAPNIKRVSDLARAATAAVPGRHGSRHPGPLAAAGHQDRSWSNSPEDSSRPRATGSTSPSSKGSA
mgnify:CR=1 FL=1